jgi:hypothetical protein
MEIEEKNLIDEVIDTVGVVLMIKQAQQSEFSYFI